MWVKKYLLKFYDICTWRFNFLGWEFNNENMKLRVSFQGLNMVMFFAKKI
jgi:hypothetical protein